MKQSLESLETLKDVQLEDVSNRFDNIYVLAHGEPYLPLSMDSKIRILAAMVLVMNNKEAKIFFVGGGLPIGGEQIAKQMSDYFDKINRSNEDKLTNNTYILDKSNNTVANIKEISESLDLKSAKQKNIVIISNKYHTSRIRKILKCLGLEMNVLAAEDLLQNVSNLHKDIIEKYKASLSYKGKALRDKLLSAYLKIDPNESLIEKIVQKNQKWRMKK